MTYDELKQKISLIKETAINEENALIRNFIIEHTTNKIGDVISDHRISIKIDKIKHSYHSFPPCAVYCGVELTKKGELNKRGSRNSIYQFNIITK